MNNLNDRERLAELRAPKTTRERYIAAMYSTKDDLFEDEATGNIIVTGFNLERERLYLGEVSQDLAYRDPVAFYAMIDKVRFGR